MKFINAVFAATLVLFAAVGSVQTAVASGSEVIARAHPYDEQADAKAEITEALSQAKADKVSVLLVFGANWCGDCKVLEAAMKSGTVSHMIAHDFKLVKVNVGRFDKNTDLAAKYGVPLKSGIPAIVMLSADEAVLFATKAGELANAKKMGEVKIYEFLKKAAAGTKVKS